MDFSFIIFLLFIPFSYPKFIQIHDITNNPGALTLSAGEGRILEGYDRLLHTVDLKELGVTIGILESLVIKINSSTGDFSKLIDHKLKEINNTYKALLPNTSRNKRSIETLGSAIKFITGNLDAQDLRQINSNINAIKMSDNKLIDQNNKQIVINQEFQNRLQTLSDEVKNYQNVIFKLNTQKGYSITENAKISILFQLDIVLQTLRTIENGIALAKLNIVNRQLLTINELKIIAQQLKQVDVRLDSLEDAYNYLSVTVFYHGYHLIISIDIPKVSSTIYERVIIEQLPIQNKTVNIGHQTVLVHSNETFAVLTEIEQIAKIYVYKRNQLLNITNDLCIAPLVRGRSGKCPFKETPPTTEYKLLTYGTLVVKATLENVVMSSTCGINQKELRGNYLIIFHNCSVIIQDRLFENLELNFNHPIISPLETYQIEESHLERYYNNSYLHKMHIENRQHLDSLKTHHFSSIGAIFIIISIIIIVIAYGQRNVIATLFIRSPGRASLGDGLVNNGAADLSTPQSIVFPETTFPDVQSSKTPASVFPEANSSKTSASIFPEATFLNDESPKATASIFPGINIQTARHHISTATSIARSHHARDSNAQ